MMRWVALTLLSVGCAGPQFGQYKLDNCPAWSDICVAFDGIDIGSLAKGHPKVEGVLRSAQFRDENATAIFAVGVAGENYAFAGFLAGVFDKDALIMHLKTEFGEPKPIDDFTTTFAAGGGYEFAVTSGAFGILRNRADKTPPPLPILSETPYRPAGKSYAGMIKAGETNTFGRLASLATLKNWLPPLQTADAPVRFASKDGILDIDESTVHADSLEALASWSGSYAGTRFIEMFSGAPFNVKSIAVEVPKPAETGGTT